MGNHLTRVVGEGNYLTREVSLGPNGLISLAVLTAPVKHIKKEIASKLLPVVSSYFVCSDLDRVEVNIATHKP